MADPAIMERVIVNLVGNALRYAPAGSPFRLTASALGNRVQLRVIDCGPGIPEADRERAFRPFRRLGDTSKTTGVGLGLAVSRGLTEAMGGAVEPEETPGGGLTMVVSLPAATQAGSRGSSVGSAATSTSSAWVSAGSVRTRCKYRSARLEPIGNGSVGTCVPSSHFAARSRSARPPASSTRASGFPWCLLPGCPRRRH